MNMQHILFQQIRDKMPPNLSLADEISYLLDISTDSAYRRIRGKKSLSMKELQRLCSNYEISVDTLFNIKSENIIFSYKPLDNKLFNFEQYLINILNDFKKIQNFGNKEIIYFAKDIPIFQYFQLSELAIFKIFFWHKTILQFPGYEEKLFSFEEVPEALLETGRKILNIYIKLPVIEIWNEDTINSILRQIEFYWESGFFKRKEDALLLCESIDKLISHIQKQAKCGFMFLYQGKAVGLEGNYKFYHNEVILGDNTIFVTMNNNKITYLTYNVLNFLTTTNPAFCHQTHESLKILMKKSSLISVASEKERNRFFNKLFEKIKLLKTKIV